MKFIRVILFLFTAALSWNSFSQCSQFNGPSTICPNSTATLVLNSGIQGNSYLLLRDNMPEGQWVTPTQSVQMLFWTVDKTGTYKLQVSGSACVTGQVVISLDNSTPQNNLSISSSIEAPSYCANQALTLTASGGNGTYSWSGSDGTTRSGKSINITLYSTITYTVTSGATSNCSTSSVAISASRQFTVKPQVAVPPVPDGPPSRCMGAGVSTYSVSTNNYDYYTWSMVSTPNAGSTNNNHFDPTTRVVTWDPTFNGTVAIKVKATGCGGEREATKTVYVNAPFAKPDGTTSEAQICSAKEVSFYGTSLLGNPIQTGVTHRWYANSSKTSLIYDFSVVPNIPSNLYQTKVTRTISATTTLYVSSVLNGCESALTPVTITLVPYSSAPISASGASLCGTGEAVLTASGPSNATFTWLNSSGAAVGSGTRFKTPVLSNTISQDPQVFDYSVRVDIPNTCSRTISTPVSVYQGYYPPSVPSTTACYDGTATLTATGGPAGKTFIWMFYDSNENLLWSGANNTFTTGKLTAETTFYVAYQLTQTPGCRSTMVPVKVKINPKPSTPSANSVSGFGSVVLAVNSLLADHKYQWYADINGNKVLLTTTEGVYAPEIPIGATKTFYVKAVNSFGCESDFSAAISATSNLPHVITNLLKVKETNENNIGSLTIDQKQQKIVYMDGLLRPIQEVVTQGSPSRNDIVQPIAYDQFGRTPKQFLTFTGGNDGTYKSTALVKNGDYLQSDQYSFYQNTPKVAVDSKPFVTSVFDPSPAGFLIEQGAAGKTWTPTSAGGDGETVVPFFRTNDVNDKVRIWSFTASATTFGTVASSGFYPTPYNQLTVNQIQDEEGHTVLTFTNKTGQTILKRTVLGTNNFMDTYYIFDDFGLQRAVVPPAAVEELQTATPIGAWTLSDTFLRKWCYIYHYDKFGRLAQKRVPGTDPVYMVYNNRDQLILTQDGNQRPRKEWSFVKYDELGRVVYEGVYTHTAADNQPTMQGLVDAYTGSLYEARTSTDYTTQFGYTLTGAYPNITATNSKILKVNYYDDYLFDKINNRSTEYSSSELNLQESAFGRVTNQITGKKVRILGTDQFLTSLIFYDKTGKVLQVKEENHLGGIDTETSKFDFIGNVVESLHRHNIASQTETLVKKGYSYDHSSRLTKLFNQVMQDVEWKDVIGASNSNKVLTGTAGTGWGSSGAASVNIIPAGEDGGVEMFVKETNAARMLGLSSSNTNAHYSTINYAIYPANDGKVYVYENQVSRGSFGNYSSGDLLSVERRGTTVFYKRNNVIIYTSTVASTTSLIADVAFYNTNATISNARMYYGGRVQMASYAYNEVGQLVDKKLGVETSISSGNIRRGTTIESPAYDNFDVYKATEQIILKDGFQFAATSSKTFTAEIEQEVALQSVDYRYNIRGWMTNINNSALASDNGVTNDDNNDLFGFELKYNSGIQSGATAKFNGEIAETIWNTRNRSTGAAGEQKAFGYSYDAVGRLTRARYAAKGSAGWTVDVDKFNEEGPSNTTVPAQDKWIQYDKNGNIIKLNRNSGSAIDILSYNYGTTGNQLQKVVDAATTVGGFKDGANTDNDYTYDANGNQLTDKNKGITTSIKYNILNLPEEIMIGTKKIQYVYTVEGTRLKKIVTDGTSVINNYISGYEYSNTTILFFATEVGRVTKQTNKYNYEYFLTDHLGNLRVAFDKNPVNGLARQIQEEGYYPFGERIEAMGFDAGSPSKYLYSGMELQGPETGLNYYLTDYRNYDPLLGRFNGVDPMTDKLRGINPYHFAYNNPVTFNDPRGDMPLWGAMAIGAVAGTAVGYTAATIAGKTGTERAQWTVAGGIIGAAVGAGTWYLSNASQSVPIHSPRYRTGQSGGGYSESPISYTDISNSAPSTSQLNSITPEGWDQTLTSSINQGSNVTGNLSSLNKRGIEYYVDPQTFQWTPPRHGVRFAYVRDVTFAICYLEGRSLKYETYKFDIEVQTPVTSIDQDTYKDRFNNPEVAKQDAARAAEWAFKQMERNMPKFDKETTKFHTKRQFIFYMQESLQEKISGSLVVGSFEKKYLKFSRPMNLTLRIR